MTMALSPAHKTSTIPLGLLSALGIFILGLILMVNSDWPLYLLFSRVDALTLFSGLAPGTDITLLLAHHLLTVWKFSPVAALFAASLAAFPIAMALVMRTTSNQPLQASLLTLGNPLVLSLFMAGYGWSVIGFYGLWRLLVELPQKQPHHGMPHAGVGLGGAYLCVPDFGQYLLPMAALLFLCAPKHMLAKDMRVFYLLSFTPALMIWGSYAYSAFLFGGMPSPEAIGFNTLQHTTLFTALALVLCAPALLGIGLLSTGIFGTDRLGKSNTSLVRITIIGVLVLTAITGPAPSFLLCAAAALGQSAVRASYGTARLWTSASLICSAIVLYALDRAPGLSG